MIRANCPDCGSSAEFPPASAGMRMKCRVCPGWFPVPSADEGSQRCACGFQVKVGRMAACPQCGKRFSAQVFSDPPTPAVGPSPPARIGPRPSVDSSASVPAPPDGGGERPRHSSFAFAGVLILILGWTLIRLTCLGNQGASGPVAEQRIKDHYEKEEKKRSDEFRLQMAPPPDDFQERHIKERVEWQEGWNRYLRERAAREGVSWNELNKRWYVYRHWEEEYKNLHPPPDEPWRQRQEPRPR